MRIAISLTALIACACAKKKEAPPSPPPPAASVDGPAAPEPEPEPGGATIVSSTGTVEIRRGTSEAWDPVKQGDRLLAEDSVRTQDDGVMELAVNRTRVRIRERSEFQIKTVTDQVLRARARGHIDGEVPAGQGKLEVRAMEGDAVVGSEGGEFSMTADDKGVVAVAAKGGEVSLTSAGRTVNLKSGQVSRVRPGQGPDAPAAALRRVLLSVAWPARKETNQRRYPIAGKVEAGTRVLVQGRPVAVDPEGNFHVEVPLRDGKQNVAVVAVDVLGRRAAADAAVRFDNKLDARLREQLWGR